MKKPSRAKRVKLLSGPSYSEKHEVAELTQLVITLSQTRIATQTKMILLHTINNRIQEIQHEDEIRQVIRKKRVHS